MSKGPSVDDLFAKANAHAAAGRYRPAETLLRAIVQSRPDLPKPLNNLGVLLKTTGRTAEAAEVLAKAVALAPDDATYRYGLGTALLSLGRYAEGWPFYEARAGVETMANRKPQVPWPEWMGQELAGRRLAVWPEQGLGDKIQFSRFFPALQALGAEVMVLCEPALARLFAENFSVNVVAASGDTEFPDPDYWIGIGSLPLRLGVTLDNLPTEPYLRAHRAWPDLGLDGPKIGLMTRGSPGHANDANRSLPSDAAARLHDLPFSLVDLDPNVTGAQDFADTAAILDQLDLVVSVDTSVSHLAGAMGKPCRVLIPGSGTDWRWMHERTDSPWYPSITLYRQDAASGWGPTIERVLADVVALF